ncbi:MAG: hypothetical protein M1836_006158 [Candelina mexicana]|nr:MAG: hypothetical protein M1836_006158 [Candelina mexicana]
MVIPTCQPSEEGPCSYGAISIHLAEVNVSQDLAQELGSDHERPPCGDEDGGSRHVSTSGSTRPRSLARYSTAASYGLVGFLASGSKPTFSPALQIPDIRSFTSQEFGGTYDEERSLLRDNNFVPQGSTSHQEGALRKILSRLGQHLNNRVDPKKVVGDEETTLATAGAADENPRDVSSSLTNTEQCHSTPRSLKGIGKIWEEGVAPGEIQTSWQREAKVLGKYSQPLVATFFLQYSLIVATDPYEQHFRWGFIGAPIAMVVTDNLLPLCLLLYVRFIDGKDCWGGFSMRAFEHWGPMVRLALSGLLMFEVLYYPTMKM